MNYIIENLAREFRGRDDEIYTLTSLIGDPRDASPPSIFIYGPSATGKTAIIKRLINEYNRQFPCPSITALDEHGCDQRLEGDTAGSWFAYVDCVECNTPRLVFERALNRWAGWQPSESNRYTSIAKCESSVDFVNRINQIAKCTPARASGVWEGDATRYLVLDHAERIRDLGPLFLSALARLNELVSEASATADARGQCSATYRGGGGSVCTIMISQVVWDKFRPRHGGAPDPLMVRFEDYSKQVVLDIVAQDCPQDEPLEFFLTFVDAVYEVFHRNCVNLNELRHLVALLYPRYVEPVYEGQATRNETARLFRLCQPYFMAATDKLFLREISSSEWQRSSMRSSARNDPSLVTTSITKMAAPSDGLDLPYYTKFLLISGFLASYNPTKMDVQYFARTKGDGGFGIKRRGRKPKAKEAMANGMDRQQLLGPKAFPIERMLAIFYSILDNPVDCTVNVYSQVASLITLRLLVRTTPMDKLETMRCRCNVSYDFIRQVSQSVMFDIDRYLYNFV